jgi:serine/threonine protein phosphatase PrpC
MRKGAIKPATYFLGRDMKAPAMEKCGPGRVCVYSSPCPGREGPNEDAALWLEIDPQRCVLALADGFGGHPSGARAAETALLKIEAAFCDLDDGNESLITAIVAGFEEAGRAVREWGIGAATTLSLVAVDGTRVRSCHVGDSSILVTGQRGRVKLHTMSHSPVGYAVESGFMDEHEAMHHEERHLVSNMIGAEDMHLELGPVLDLSPRDTILIGSDGLWDNVLFDEVVAGIRKGPLDAGVKDLAFLCHQRMRSPAEREPSKPDDLTLVAFRLG